MFSEFFPPLISLFSYWYNAVRNRGSIGLTCFHMNWLRKWCSSSVIHLDKCALQGHFNQMQSQSFKTNFFPFGRVGLGNCRSLKLQKVQRWFQKMFYAVFQIEIHMKFFFFKSFVSSSSSPQWFSRFKVNAIKKKKKIKRRSP